MTLHFWKIKERGPGSDILHFLGALQSADIATRQGDINRIADGETDVSLYCFQAPDGPNDRFSKPIQPMYLIRAHFNNLLTAVGVFTALCEALPSLPADVRRVRIWASSRGKRVKVEIGFLDGTSAAALRNALSALLPGVMWFKQGDASVIPENLLIPSPTNRGVVPFGGDPVF